MNTDESKRRRRGPAPLDDASRRTGSVSVRLNESEMAQLDAQRRKVAMQRGEYLRAAALHKLPPSVPAINREAWAELARLAGNLNQLVRLAHGGDLRLAEVQALVQELRRVLIGVRPRRGGQDEGED